MKHLITPMVLSVPLLIASTGLALAVNVHNPAVGGTGVQGPPDQTIGSAQTGSVTPGNTINSPGSAFNPNGNADTRYAGTQPQNSKNPKSVAQYDVAGFQQSHKPPK